MNYQNLLFFGGIITLLVIIVVIVLIVVSGKQQTSFYQEQKQQVQPMTKTYIGPVQNYQLLPVTKNPNGGWDSISEWYDSDNKKQYWTETWGIK